jgi:hypothetical protein
VLRIAVEGAFDPMSATPGLKAMLSRAGGVSTFEQLEAELASLQDRARAIFDQQMKA